MIGKDRDQLAQRWLAFWAQENHDTLLISITAPRDGAQPFASAYRHASLDERWHDIDYKIASVRHHMENTYFGGDAYPMAFPDLGPDLIGAICGCDLRFGEGTSWAMPCVEEWETLPPSALTKTIPGFRRSFP